MLTNEEKKQILISVLDTVESISDKEYQKKVWILGKGPEVEDFDEICCNFFGDGDPLLENYKDFGLTKSQYLVLKKFRNIFRTFSNNDYNPYDFIDTPEWQKITEFAKDVLIAFDWKPKNKV